MLLTAVSQDQRRTVVILGCLCQKEILQRQSVPQFAREREGAHDGRLFKRHRSSCKFL